MHKSENPDLHKNMIMESRNASFFEDVFPCKEENIPNKLLGKVVKPKKKMLMLSLDVEKGLEQQNLLVQIYNLFVRKWVSKL